MSAPSFSESSVQPAHGRRINPWRLFIGSMIPNWLQCRREVCQGAKIAYARLAQYAGKDGECFPKQETLAAELGVSERTANDYVRTLVKHKLIEMERPGLGKSNRYFFLDHPWIHDGQPETSRSAVPVWQKTSHPERKISSAQERQEASAPIVKENQEETNQIKRGYPHGPPKGEFMKGHSANSNFEEDIYAAYPKKVGKPAALRAIRRALCKCPFDILLERTRLYAQTCNSPAEFIPNPSTWFNQERFNDDPATWRRAPGSNGKPPPAIIRSNNFISGESKL